MSRSSPVLQQSFDVSRETLAWHPSWFWAVAYVPIATALTLTHMSSIDIPRYELQREAHNAVLTATTKRPYNIRVLQPVVVQAIQELVLPGRPAKAFLLGYGLIRWASLLVTFCVAEALLSRFGPRTAARLTVLLLAGMHPLSYLNYTYQPTSVLDLAFLAIGLYWMVKGLHWPLIPLVIVATANRNTSAFICLAYGLWHLDSLWTGTSTARRKYVLLCVALGLVWLGETFILERLYPAHEWVHTPEFYIRYNLTHPFAWLFAGTMWAPLAVCTLMNWREASPQLKRLSLWLVPYIGVHLLMTRADEVRYWLPMYLVLGPYCVFAFRRIAAR